MFFAVARRASRVLLDRTTPSWKRRYGVYANNREGARQAVRHLFRHGDRCIVYVNGPADLSQSIDRRLGVEDVMAEKGIPQSALAVLDGGFTLEGAYAAMSAYLERGSTQSQPLRPVFAANDVMALGVLRALKEHGVCVPSEVEVIGFDDIELARMLEPALSTVSQPAIEMGALSAEVLLRLLRGERPRVRRHTLAPSLRLRATTRAL
ncbi:substrate-binding domain-containing protein [Niveibacterium sp. SC-1]|uniref:substrate-binding domain-containing protein n=1 Tax=Niveibacterium sp. SC-1 TaxID=3135646 RepID=UPI00311E92D1